MVEFVDKTSEQSGTPINRENMMAIQGFFKKNIIINEETNVITEVNPFNNHTMTTSVVENDDGSIVVTERFVGDKVITKTTTINPQGNVISEVIE
jgi:hypothetical protein